MPAARQDALASSLLVGACGTLLSNPCMLALAGNSWTTALPAGAETSASGPVIKAVQTLDLQVRLVLVPGWHNLLCVCLQPVDESAAMPAG